MMSFPADEARAQLIVKNTFFDVADEKPRCRRSSSSLPPSLRLAGLCSGGKAASPGVGKAAVSGAPSDASSVDTSSTAAETPTEAELLDAEVSDDLSGSESAERPSHRWWAEARNPRAADPTRGLQMHMVQVQGIASVVEASLKAAPGVLRTQALRHECGWSLTAEVAVDMLQQSRGVLLGCAKQALLAASEHSSSVYVLGYQQEPFVEDDLGFSVTLCDVQDTNAACWKYLETGCCRFQGRCRWHHPWCYTLVNVMLLPSVA